VGDWIAVLPIRGGHYYS